MRLDYTRERVGNATDHSPARTGSCALQSVTKSAQTQTHNTGHGNHPLRQFIPLSLVYVKVGGSKVVTAVKENGRVERRDAWHRCALGRQLKVGHHNVINGSGDAAVVDRRARLVTGTLLSTWIRRGEVGVKVSRCRRVSTRANTRHDTHNKSITHHTFHITHHTSHYIATATTTTTTTATNQPINQSTRHQINQAPN